MEIQDEQGRVEAVARESVRVHLRDAGLNAREEDGRVRIGLGPFSCRVYADEGLTNGSRRLVPLWFDLALNADETKIISECVTGIGATAEEAAVSAAHDWVTTIFAPFRTFADYGHVDDEVDVFPLPWMDDENRVTVWNVHAGPVRMFSRDNTALAQDLSRGLPLMLVLKALASYLAEPRLHWVKTLLSSSSEGLNGEVRIDNQLDEHAFECLKQFQWHAAHGGMFRQFYVLVPDRNAPPPLPEAVERLRQLRDRLRG